MRRRPPPARLPQPVSNGQIDGLSHANSDWAAYNWSSGQRKEPLLSIFWSIIAVVVGALVVLVAFIIGGLRSIRRDWLAYIGEDRALSIPAPAPTIAPERGSGSVQRVTPAPFHFDEAPFGQVFQLLCTGRISVAAQVLADRLNEAPDCPKATGLMGVVSLLTGEWDGAVARLQQAVASDPSLSDFSVALALALRRIGQKAEAAASLQHLKSLSEDALSRRRLFEAQSQLRQFAKAYEDQRIG